MEIVYAPKPADDGTSKPCVICGGTGEITLASGRTVTCPHCKGTGIEPPKKPK